MRRRIGKGTAYKAVALATVMTLFGGTLSGCSCSSGNTEPDTAATEEAGEESTDDNSGSNTGDNSGTNEEIEIDAAISRVSVHDPSIVKDGDTYYIFGSHMAWAKSTDLVNWTTFTNNINSQYSTLFAAEAEWAKKAGGAYDVSGNLWAPDVIYNETMGKWCMYMSINGPDWNSTISLLTADSLDGNWTYVGPVIQSGMSVGYGVTFDYEKVTGESTVNSRYTSNVRNGGATYEPHAIDPCVTYDDEGNLWMTYGSWTGGIGMIRLDNETGLRDYSVTYEYEEGVTDPYIGYKISGGNKVSGEASYIEKIGDYYYLFVSYGGLVANGGYSMRIFRSENITGPYTDPSGDDARYPLNGGAGSTDSGSINGKSGIKLMTYYQWSHMKFGQVAQGHNSAFVDDDGKAYVVYHTRTNDGTEGHSVRVHQLFVNEDGWIMAAPYEYRGESLNESGYDMAAVAGTYDILIHKSAIDYTNLECVTPQEITLGEDGKVSGDVTGTWEMKDGTPYVNITLGDIEYKGVLVEQYIEETNYKTMCFTAIGSDEVVLWGSKHLSGKDAVDLTIATGAVTVPSTTFENVVFETEGLSGTTVTYKSSDTGIMSDDGKLAEGAAGEVKVTATFKNGDYSVDKEYTIKILGAATEDGKILVGEYYTDEELNISNAAEGTYQFPNPFNKNVTTGLQIYNGVSIEFDVKGSGSYLSNILSFYGGGRMYFTGGSYLGYNATGGYFDANVQNGTAWSAGTDFIKGEATVRIELKATGFEVYFNDELAYTNEDIGSSVKGSAELSSYNDVLIWLNNTAETINFGWGSWWTDKFNGTISNVKLYAYAVEQEDTSGYTWYESFNGSGTSAWTSASAAGSLSVGNDGDERGNYVKFAADAAASGNRGAYMTFDEAANVTGKYTLTMDVALTAGIIGQRSESGFAILGTDAVGHDANSMVTSGYILKLTNTPPADAEAKVDNASNQNNWIVNDSDKTATIPAGTWVTITAEVDTSAKTAIVKIVNASDGTVYFEDTVTINGNGIAGGVQLLRGRGIGTMSIDTITVK